MTGQTSRVTVRPVDSNIACLHDNPGDLLDREVSIRKELGRAEPGITYPEHRGPGDEHAVGPQFRDVLRAVDREDIERDLKAGEKSREIFAVGTVGKGIEFDGHETGPLHTIGSISVSAMAPRATSTNAPFGTSQASPMIANTMPFFPGCWNADESASITPVSR